MTINEQILAMVAMAVAIVAILTVGTLIAADIIHVGSRRPRRSPDMPSNPSLRQRTGPLRSEAPGRVPAARRRDGARGCEHSRNE